MKPRIRCSELDRILACPGSLTLNARVDPREGDEGLMGTAVHYIAHSRIKAELGAVGDLGPEPDLSKAKLSEWIANFYVREVQESIPPDWSLECEAALEWEFENFILTGHPDDIGMSPDTTEACGLDLKAGYIPVDIAEENWQMSAYGVLLRLNYPELLKLRYKIVQPRNDEDDGHPRVSEFYLEPTVDNPDPIGRLVAILEQKINDAIKRDRELETGRVQCRWCSAALQCAAAIKLRDEMKHTLTDEDIADVKRRADDVTLAGWVIAAKTLSRPIEDAMDLAKERIAEVGSIVSAEGETLTVKTSAGSYEVVDPAGYMAAFRTILPGEDDLVACFKPSQTKVKDRISEKMNVPKSGKAAVTSTTIFDGHLRIFVKQNERQTIVIS